MINLHKTNADVYGFIAYKINPDQPQIVKPSYTPFQDQQGPYCPDSLDSQNCMIMMTVTLLCL